MFAIPREFPFPFPFPPNSFGGGGGFGRIFGVGGHEDFGRIFEGCGSQLFPAKNKKRNRWSEMEWRSIQPATNRRKHGQRHC